MHVVVEWLHSAESLQVGGGLVGLVLVKPRERPQCVARHGAQALTLVEGPLGVRLVGEEVVPVELGSALEALDRLRPSHSGDRYAAARHLLLELVDVDPDPLAVERVATASRHDEGGLAVLGAVGLEPLA